jgi:sulfite exporter TauE/SafE
MQIVVLYFTALLFKKTLFLIILRKGRYLVIKLLKTDNVNLKKLMYRLFIFLIIVICIIVLVISVKKIFNVDIVDIFKNLFLLKYLPKLGNDTSYGLIFIFGILTSFHCIGMCGGIAISQTVKKNELQRSNNRLHSVVLPSLFYNIGRVTSYTIVGAVVGGLGGIISFAGVWKGIVPIISGIFMIIMAINLLGIFKFLRRLNIRMPYFATKRIFQGNGYSPIIVGLLSGLMPCGPLQMMQLYALSTKSILYGAVSMLVFSMGTMPLLFTFGTINTFLNKKFSKIILKVSAVLVFSLGIVMIGRGLALAGISIEKPNTNIAQNGDTAFAVIKGNSQTVQAEVQSDSFPEIVVVKGVPVKWNMHVDKDNLNDCNKEFQVSKFKIDKSLAIGDNIVEFTPNESGNFIYSCWMGMIKSKVIVVDNQSYLKKIQQKSTTSTSAKQRSVSTTPSSLSKKTTNSNAVVQTFTGYITTEDDFAASLKEDTAFMIYMRLMALSGLGITFQQDGQWVFYYIDGNIATDNKKYGGEWTFDGTGSQLDAWKLVEAQVKDNNGANKMKPVPVTITGTLNENIQTNPGLDADGKYFPVITVKSITKN